MTVHLREGYDVVDGKVTPRRPDSWKHRTDAHNTSRKVWLCKACYFWHEEKPGICFNSECRRTQFHSFPSAGEARWFMTVVRRLAQGEISALVIHPVYKIYVVAPDGHPVHVFNYVADAEWREKDGTVVTADYKARYNPSKPTKRKREAALDPVFKLKRDCFESQYGRRVTIFTESSNRRL